MSAPGRRTLLVALVTLMGSAATLAADRNAPTGPLNLAGIDTATGRQVPLSLPVVTSAGEHGTLGDQLDRRTPVVLTLAYLRCPMLCELVTKGLADGLRTAGLRVGADVRAITVSFDPADTPDAAQAVHAGLCASLGEAACDWRVLLAREPAAKALAARLGFQYAFDAASGTYAHPAVVYVLSPDGRVSDQLAGVTFDPARLRGAIARAARGEAVERPSPVLIRCFAYVPALRQHAAALLTFQRIGWTLVVGLGALAMAALSRRVRRRTR